MIKKSWHLNIYEKNIIKKFSFLFLVKMDEYTEDTSFEKTLSDEDFNPNELEPDTYDDNEWEEINQLNRIGQIDLGSDDSASQISSTLSKNSSTVWLHFVKNPTHAQGYNICKECSKKYSVTT